MSSFTKVDNKSGKYVILKDVGFVEACAGNAAYDKMRNDNETKCYVPAQTLSEGLRIFEISTNKLDEGATVVMDVSLSINGSKVSTGLTCFGCKLSDNGTLWCCLFNVNKIIGIDLNEKKVTHVFDNVPCPNDLCINKEHPQYLYVACGTSFGVSGKLLPDQIHQMLGNKKVQPLDETSPTPNTETSVNIPAQGQVIRIDTRKTGRRALTPVLQESLKVLAGIECSDSRLYFSQLTNCCSVPLNILDGKKHRTKLSADWKGTDVGDGEYCYLADNISRWSSTKNCTAVYRKVKASQVTFMENAIIATVGWAITKFISRIVTFFTECRCDKIGDSEVLLVFSLLDSFENVCFFVTDQTTQQSEYFEFPPPAAPAGVTYDGHVTHVERHGGKVAFVNFKSDAILFLDEDVFVCKS